MFNKSYQDLPSKPKAQMASGPGRHWLIEGSTMLLRLWLGEPETAPNYDVAITFWFGEVETTHNRDVAIMFWFGLDVTYI